MRPLSPRFFATSRITSRPAQPIALPTAPRPLLARPAYPLPTEPACSPAAIRPRCRRSFNRPNWRSSDTSSTIVARDGPVDPGIAPQMAPVNPG